MAVDSCCGLLAQLPDEGSGPSGLQIFVQLLVDPFLFETGFDRAFMRVATATRMGSRPKWNVVV
jgi:hypothetical protein